MQMARSAGQYIEGLDEKLRREAMSRAIAAEPEIQQARARGIARRTDEIQGRSPNEQADMLVARMAEARKMQGDMSPNAILAGQASPVDLRRLAQAVGMKGAGGQGKYKNKGTIDAPEMKTAEALQMMQNAPDGGREFARVMAEGEGPDAQTRGMMAVQQANRNLGSEGTTGKLSRGAAYAGMAGGITASGAALIDLMKYLAQGQQVDAEREDVLRS